LTTTIRSRTTWPSIFGELGAELSVARNDEITLEAIRRLAPDRIVLSPGPGSPEDARDFGLCGEILKKISPSVPTLGVCLGHQGIATVYGGRIRRARTIMHGKVSRIFHDGQGCFTGLPQGFVAARYHSLVIDRDGLPEDVTIAALSDDGEIMAVRHRRFPIEGLQFHPESILTEHGREILRNFLQGVSSCDRARITFSC
jgi:anthranilate synthase/aminodeoxychorismate synthase-like glutamine amidotransferase